MDLNYRLKPAKEKKIKKNQAIFIAIFRKKYLLKSSPKGEGFNPGMKH